MPSVLAARSLTLAMRRCPGEREEPLMVREVLFGVLLVAPTMSQGAEPANLVLACQGHTQYLGDDSQSSPISLGIIVNLADRIVQGFPSALVYALVDAARL